MAPVLGAALQFVLLMAPVLVAQAPPPFPSAAPQRARIQPAGEQIREPETPGLKFKNTPLELVLRDYAEKTRRTILAAPNLPNVTINLESQQDLTMQEYLEAIESVLAMNGVGLINVGDKFLKVVPIAQARQEAMKIQEADAAETIPENDSLISQLIPLKYIELAEAIKIITPLKHPHGQIHPLERSNSLLVTDASSTINRILQILKIIDQPIPALEEPIVIQIRFAKAADIKRKLEEILADVKKDKESTVPRSRDSGPPGVIRPTPTAATAPPGVIRPVPPRPTTAPSASSEVAAVLEEVDRGVIRGEVKIIADERTNILIIITRPENMAFFEKIIKVLDVETAPEVLVKVIRLEYAEAESVASTINSLIGAVSKGPDAKPPAAAGAEAKGESVALREYVERIERERAQTAESKVKSKIGELSAENIKLLSDKRTNSIIIMASRADMAALEEMIRSMDIMLSQVLIEVVIFKITLNNSYERGIDIVQRALMAYDEERGGGRSAKAAFAGVAGGEKYRGSMKNPLSLNTLPSLSSTAGNLTYYATFFDVNLDAIIKLIASDNRTQIVSSPTILTTDNKKATIDVTKEKYFFKGLKFVSTSGSGAGEWVDDVEMKKVGTKLAVTPRINEKKYVVLEITQSLEEEGGSQTIQGAGGASDWPTIDSAEMTASVAVRSGETIVLGGLAGHSRVRNKSRVPLLGDIPIIGTLFQYKKTEDSRNEIIVFITPYVLDTPEEIERETRRRRDAVDVSDMWPKSSASRMAADASKAEKAPATSAGARSVRQESEQHQKKEYGDLDPELANFIREQEQKWGKSLKEIDRRTDSEFGAVGE